MRWLLNQTKSLLFFILIFRIRISKKAKRRGQEYRAGEEKGYRGAGGLKGQFFLLDPISRNLSKTFDVSLIFDLQIYPKQIQIISIYIDYVCLIAGTVNSKIDHGYLLKQ